jgi:hypothetical protein
MTAPFTIAIRPHTKRRNQTRRFLKLAEPTKVTVDGVDIVGGNGDFHIDGYRVTIAEASRSPYWWLWGNGITPVEVADPVDAVAVLRKRDLIRAKAS